MEEKDFKKLMQHSKLEIQFPDFEDSLMEEIHKKEAARKSVWKNIKLSWVFLIIGMILGLVATNYLTGIELKYFGANSNLVLFAIEIMIVLLVVSQFNNLFGITFKQEDK